MRCLDLFQAQENKHSNGTVFKAEKFPRYFEAIKREKTINADNARTDPRSSEFTDPYMIELGITSMLDTGIFLGGRLVGVVCNEHIGQPREWRTEEIAFSGTVADQVAQTFANAERLQAEDALRQSEMKYRSYVDHAPIGVFVVDRTGRYIEVNDAACRLTGYAKNELLQMSIGESLAVQSRAPGAEHFRQVDRKSTRLNSSHRIRYSMPASV